jgi:hypothetical protein
MRQGGYAFDAWSPDTGLSRGYDYRRIGDAYYARKSELSAAGKGSAGTIVACNTTDEFARETA